MTRHPTRDPNPTIDLDPAYFQAAIKDYENWKEKWWREAIQNSVDAGATKIACVITENEDGTWTVSAEDDGGGMEREVLLTKFLRLGGTTKVGASGMAGGFGKAKELLILPWLSWEVHSRDVIARGAANDYEVFDAPMLRGTKLTVRMAANNYTYGAPAISFIQKCFLPHVSFTVTTHRRGYDRTEIETEIERPKAALVAKNAIQSVPGKFDLFFTPAKSTAYNLMVRANGLYMFDVYVGETVQGYVIAEITGPSIDLLSANRDGFRDAQAKYALQDFARKVAVDVKSALRNEQGLIRQVFKGSGKFIARDTSEKVARDVGPVASGSPQSRVVTDILATVEQYRDDAPAERSGGFTAKPPTRNASEAMLALAPPLKSRDDVERAVKQLVWKPDFFVMNEIENKRVGAEFFPETMSPRVAKLASVWTELCRFVLIQLGSSAEYGVGFAFSHDMAAAAVTHEKETWLVLNPYRDMRAQKHLWRPSIDEDLQWLYAAAIHEATHVADGIDYHDEAFAAALTHNMARCSKGWRKVKEIASSIRMGEGREADEADERRRNPIDPWPRRVQAGRALRSTHPYSLAGTLSSDDVLREDHLDAYGLARAVARFRERPDAESYAVAERGRGGGTAATSSYVKLGGVWSELAHLRSQGSSFSAMSTTRVATGLRRRASRSRNSSTVRGSPGHALPGPPWSAGP